MFFFYITSPFFRNLVLLFLAVFFTSTPDSHTRSNNSRVSSDFNAVIKTWLAAWFYSLLLLLIGDVELNPGPKCNSSNALSSESKEHTYLQHQISLNQDLLALNLLILLKFKNALKY